MSIWKNITQVIITKTESAAKIIFKRDVVVIEGFAVAGSDKEIQFNDAGNMGSDSSLTFDKSDGTLEATKFKGDGSEITGIIQHLNIDFDYTDLIAGVVSIGTVPAGVEIFRCVVSITQEFDSAIQITIGDAVAQGRLMSATENINTVVGNFYTSPDYVYSVATALNLYLNGSALQGTGKIIIYYS